MQTTDKTHLMALISSLGRERQRLSEARNDGERALRAAWVAQIEREIAAEETFLGMEPAPSMSDDELFAELGL